MLCRPDDENMVIMDRCDGVAGEEALSGAEVGGWRGGGNGWDR